MLTPMMAIANPVSYTEARSGIETNDRSSGVSADVARAMDSLPALPLLVLVCLSAVGTVCYARRRRRNARIAARLLPPDLPEPAPGPPCPHNPALTPEGNALLLWLRSHHLPATVAPEPDGVREEAASGDRPEKECPYCGKRILAAAAECTHCGEFLDGRESQAQAHGAAGHGDTCGGQCYT